MRCNIFEMILGPEFVRILIEALVAPTTTDRLITLYPFCGFNDKLSLMRRNLRLPRCNRLKPPCVFLTMTTRERTVVAVAGLAPRGNSKYFTREQMSTLGGKSSRVEYAADCIRRNWNLNLLPRAYVYCRSSPPSGAFVLRQ